MVKLEASFLYLPKAERGVETGSTRTCDLPKLPRIEAEGAWKGNGDKLSKFLPFLAGTL